MRDTGQVVNAKLAAKKSEARRNDEELYESLRRVEDDMEKLAERAEQIKRRMEEVIQRCANADFSENFDGKFYLGVNSLGELQGSSLELDMTCALVSRAIEDLNRLMGQRKREANNV